jgi:peptide/nickel transport system ATP-binding protein
MPRCKVDLPPRLEIGDRDGHWAACWLYDAETVAKEGIGSAAEGVSSIPTPPALTLTEETR